MIYFDTSTVKFETFDKGYVKVSELVKTFAELETKLEFRVIYSAMVRLGKPVFGGPTFKKLGNRARVNEGDLDPKIFAAMNNLLTPKAWSALNKHKRNWTQRLFKASEIKNFKLLSSSGVPLLEKPKLSSQFANFLINPESISSWLISEGHAEYVQAIKAKTDLAVRELQIKASVQTPTTQWPWGSHSTLLLAVLSQTASRWWRNYTPTDPTTAPKQEDVIEWIAKEYSGSVSTSNAYAIAKILRPETLPKGRPKK